jgi:hypothetical protein
VQRARHSAGIILNIVLMSELHATIGADAARESECQKNKSFFGSFFQKRTRKSASF